MPLCKLCNDFFKGRQEIDGKMRNLSGRVYCLKCSPFKSGHILRLKDHYNNINPHLDDDFIGVERTCINCNCKYFYNRSKKAKRIGFSTKLCNSCHSTLRSFKNKLEAVRYKGGSCSCCGYNKNISALDFHHTDPSSKSFPISDRLGSITKLSQAVLDELDKTILMCRNCHAELHHPESTVENAERQSEHFKRLLNGDSHLGVN